MRYKESMGKNLTRTKKEHHKTKTAVIVSGTFQSNLRGFGFVTAPGLDTDIYIPVGKTNNAFYGDEVSVKLLDGFDPKIPEKLAKFEEARKAAEEDGTLDAFLAADRKNHVKGRPKDGKRTEGEVIQILGHTVTKVVGTYHTGRGMGYVVSDNSHLPYDIYIAPGDNAGAVDGHKVVAEITDYGSQERNAHGRVIEILGHMDDPGVDILSIIRANDLRVTFPDDVKEEVRTIPDHLEIPARGVSNRTQTKLGGHFEDLRRVTMVTIDGEDSKDLDDAVSLDKTEDGWELGVHIADVSHYVTEGSPLDKEALKRATSVYLVDRVIPMLPHELSNGICSLNEGEDRLALSCIMELDDDAELKSYRITESVINVSARLSYHGVHKLFAEGDPAEIEAHLEKQGVAHKKAETKRIADMLWNMLRISKMLTRKRVLRGAIDFDTTECKIILDPDGKPVDIYPYDTNESNELVENFMLMANAAVAQFLAEHELPGVYRSHGMPDRMKIDALVRFAKDQGIIAAGKLPKKITPKFVQQFLAQAKGTPYEAYLTTMTLRSMQQARYTTTCDGHFGLALDYYCHFTSPIRRYPDLQIHRIIREYLNGGWSDAYVEDGQKAAEQSVSGSTGQARKSAAAGVTGRQGAVKTKRRGAGVSRAAGTTVHQSSIDLNAAPKLRRERLVHYKSILPNVAAQSSSMERKADDAERQTDKQKMCEYMQERLGETYTGTISGLTGWGIYVALPNTVEGLVGMASLTDDYYAFDEVTYTVHGQRTGKTYRLGEEIRVLVAAVDTEARTIDFIPTPEEKKASLSALQGMMNARGSRAVRQGEHSKKQSGTGKESWKNASAGKNSGKNNSAGKMSGKEKHASRHFAMDDENTDDKSVSAGNVTADNDAGSDSDGSFKHAHFTESRHEIRKRRAAKKSRKGKRKH